MFVDFVVILNAFDDTVGIFDVVVGGESIRFIYICSIRLVSFCFELNVIDVVVVVVVIVVAVVGFRWDSIVWGGWVHRSGIPLRIHPCCP